MKDLIIGALDIAMTQLDRITIATKTQIQTRSITDVSPWDLTPYMVGAGIPSDAFLDSDDNGDVVLCWDIQVPTTAEEQLRYRVRRFPSIAFQCVYDVLMSNGYKRTSCCSSLFKQFGNTTIYDMCIEKDFDRLVKYYSLRFTKQD